MAAENSAPTTKKPDRPHRTSAVSAGSRSSRPKTRMTKTLRVLNWRARYAWAPSSTAAPISCIFSVPGSAARTCWRKNTPMTSAMIAMASTAMTRVRLVPSSCRSAAVAAGARRDIPSSSMGNHSGPPKGAPRWRSAEGTLVARVMHVTAYVCPREQGHREIAPQSRSGVRRLGGVVDRGVDVEHLVQTGDLEDLEDALLGADDAQGAVL